jgi:hypothetical protein
MKKFLCVCAVLSILAGCGAANKTSSVSAIPIASGWNFNFQTTQSNSLPDINLASFKADTVSIPLANEGSGSCDDAMAARNLLITGTCSTANASGISGGPSTGESPILMPQSIVMGTDNPIVVGDTVYFILYEVDANQNLWGFYGQGVYGSNGAISGNGYCFFANNAALTSNAKWTFSFTAVVS